MAAIDTLSYGAHPSQVVHVRRPAGTGPFPVAVLLHGGWWRDIHDLHLMDPLADDLAGSGWLVWNVEYRRTGDDGGGWPRTLLDVCAALDLLAARLAGGKEPGTPSRVVAVGHSAGGHLGLLAAPESALTAVVGLAPVTDLRASADQELGEGAVADFLGGAVADLPAETYAAASPLSHVPLGVDQLVVHGDADQRVSVAQSRAYTAAAREAGDPVEYREFPGADHFVLLDPGRRPWRTVREWLGGN